MKIQIEVEAVMDKCKDCSNFEVETLDLYGNEKLHRCKWMPYCSSIIEIFGSRHIQRGGQQANDRQ